MCVCVYIYIYIYHYAGEEQDEIVNQIINWPKKPQKIRHDWVGKVIHQELYKRLMFHHSDK